MLPLAACGFQPLYGDHSDSAALTAFLASITPVVQEARQTRTGQLIRTQLEDGLRSGGGEQPFTLLISFKESESAVAVEPDGRISRYNLHYATTYRLTRHGKLLHDGALRTIVSYNVVPSDFATYLAKKDAQERAASEIAQELRNRLATAYYDKGETR